MYQPQLQAQLFQKHAYDTPQEKLDKVLSAWNKGNLPTGGNSPNALSEHDAEKLAALAYGHGKEFKVPSKSAAKFAFNLADSASFGLLPDSIFKPSPAIGEQYFGESTADSVASGAGSLLGLAGGGYAALKGISKISNKALGAWNKWRSSTNATNVYNASMVGDDLIYLGTRNTPLLGQGPTGFSMRNVPGLPGPGVGRPGQIGGGSSLLQLAGRRNYTNDTQSMINNMTRNNYI